MAAARWYHRPVPELPDIELYLHALRPRVLGHVVRAVRIGSPFLVRTTAPAPEALVGRTLTDVRRLGKRIALGSDGPWLVLHLMIAGRLQWKAPDAALAGRMALLGIAFDHGTLVLTEAGTTRRAAVHMAHDAGAALAMDPGGLEVPGATPAAFRARIEAERHTLKRTLTDPSLLSGIGNAYSDEILHRAGLSPMRMSDALGDDEHARLFEAAQWVLSHWRDRLIAESGDAFPAKVTAFREGMAVHVRSARRRFSACATRRTKPTTAPAARPAAVCSPTAGCHGCCAATGRVRSRSWSGARPIGG
jgi:formamidopyrimidine-DNA glycosylase